MRKISIALLLTIIFVLAGCNSSDEGTGKDVTSIMLKSYDNGNVQVDFKATNNLTLVSDSADEFEIYQHYSKTDEKKYVHFTFIEQKMYDRYISEIEEEEACTIIEREIKDNIEYIYYKHENGDKVQYNKICHITDTDIYMMIYCYDSKEIADEVFKNLAIKTDK